MPPHPSDPVAPARPTTDRSVTDRTSGAPAGGDHDSPGLPGRLLLTLALLTSVAPFATDMYLPAFPTMAAELGTSASGVQLTLTAFLVGLGLGQLLVGPLSDQRGRRGLLLLGTAVTVLAGVVCALAPSIGVLTAGRFVQGLAGASGIVLARAVVTDVSRGAAAARAFSLLMVVQGVAPVVAPLVGSALFTSLGWRSVFWALTALAMLMLVAAALVVRETLPPEQRSTGGGARLRADVSRVLRTPGYVAHLLVFVFSFGSFFAYISASPFVLQTMLGLSTAQYSIVFAVNAVGIIVASASAGRLVGRTGPLVLVRTGAAAMGLGGLVLLVLALAGAVSLWPVLGALLLVVVGLGLVAGNATMLAMAQVPGASGSASALLGAAQFLLAALVSPLVGVAGESTMTPMAVVMVASSAVVGLGLLLARRADRAAQARD